MRTLNILTLAAFAGALALTPLHADEWDKRTTISINAPVELPNTTLQPGTYTLKLLNSQADRHIVTVWNEDATHLITTVLAIPNYRLQPTGKSKFTFWETPAGQPAALRAWFYPGDNFGQEFAYPKAKAQQLASVTHTEVPTMTAQEESKYSEQQQTAAVEPQPAPSNPAPEPAPAAATPAPTPEPETPPAPAPTPAEPAPAPDQTPAAAPAPAQTPMPQTASNWNEIMSAGLLLGLVGLSTFALRSKRA